jgi:Transcriptional regulators
MNVTRRQIRESARDYAIRVIRDNIVDCTLEPGSLVSENELASEMGVSRTPVREALIELSKSGIVEIFPQYGSMVSRIDYSKVEEAGFMRQVLEIAVVEDVCQKRTNADIRALEDNLALQDLYLSRNDNDKLMPLDNEFHYRLFRIAKKTLCYQLMTTLSAHHDRVRRLSLAAVKDIRLVGEHHEVLKAIREKDVGQAVRIMREHVSRYQIDKAAVRERYPQYLV